MFIMEEESLDKKLKNTMKYVLFGNLSILLDKKLNNFGHMS